MTDASPWLVRLAMLGGLVIAAALGWLGLVFLPAMVIASLAFLAVAALAAVLITYATRRRSVVVVSFAAAAVWVVATITAVALVREDRNLDAGDTAPHVVVALQALLVMSAVAALAMLTIAVVTVVRAGSERARVMSQRARLLRHLLAR